MSDFDTRLQTKLEHLDAALPKAAAPNIAAARIQARKRGRLRRLVPVLAAAAVLLGGGAVGAQRLLNPDNPEPELEAALGEAWAGVDCMSPDDAQASAQAALDSLGKADWTVALRPGVGGGTGCTFPGVIAPLHEVALFPGAGEELSGALAAVQVELFEQCLNRSEATNLLSSVLVAHGVTDFEIHSEPWGPSGYGPIDQIEEYLEHGTRCFMYGGTGHSENGKPQYYLWGPWP
jgi:hypothetical protein